MAQKKELEGDDDDTVEVLLSDMARTNGRSDNW